MDSRVETEGQALALNMQYREGGQLLKRVVLAVRKESMLGSKSQEWGSRYGQGTWAPQ
jgi:hypothetical protein